MLEGLSHLFSARPLAEVVRDLIDILIVAFLVYRALVVLKGTRAMQMGIGLVAFGVLFVIAKHAELSTVLSLLSWLASSAILIIVVVFQNDIRRALIRLGAKAWLSRGRDAQDRVIDEVVAAATELARHRMGAIICLERDANVLEFVKSDGVELDCEVTRELLVSLFVPEAVNKLHDGAVLIRDLRIAKAGVFFPMPELTKVADPALGSRHRAAIGITEETDAVVVVISEERGTITMCFPNGLVQNIDGTSLKQVLLGLFGRPPPPQKADAVKPAPTAAKISGRFTAIERPPAPFPRASDRPKEGENEKDAKEQNDEEQEEEPQEPAAPQYMTKPMEPTELFAPVADESSSGLDDSTADDDSAVTVAIAGEAAVHDEASPKP